MSDFHKRRVVMVDTQVRPSDVTKYPIINAMLDVPREDFVPDDLREAAYADAPVTLAPGRVLMEARTFAKMLDAISVGPDELVLDLGTGYGYGAAVLAKIADFVVALEEDETLSAEAEARLGEAEIDNVAVMTGPLVEGAAKHGPYDVVFIEGAVEQIPDAIGEQLREGGRIVAIFAEGNLGVVRLGQKIDGVLNWRFEFNGTAPVLPGFSKATEFAL
ncbi:protein-L-isoaspartate O-methyltransferase family protein [Maritimibacter dapengensis]|uniref:Protein-L-isoaspartate O-methyltransferase n=1 Tax=Maritimibacter dapengensis TaxID=2836868 RepID=A0ABS6T092_9RHOB|nr:protein-L-isoaspartate O-methyltransferase [Maritimibacter dapengensis]MBV7377966.1 protein-L-isoaspartate O-methyltransferase [Maritimibacter dapengensis]